MINSAELIRSTIIRFVSLTAVLVLTNWQVYADDDGYWLHTVRSSDSTMYIVDRTMPGVWQVKNGKLTEYFRASKKFRTPLNAARCAALDHDGKLLVGDSSTRQVYRFEQSDKPVPLATGVGIGIPMAIAVDADGSLFVADLELHRIFKLPAAGGEAKVFVEVSAPRGLVFDKDGQLVVLSTTKDQVHKIDAKGNKTLLVKDKPFNMPQNIVLASDGNYYVSDNYEKCIWRVTGDGKTSKLVSGDPLVNPVGLSVSGDRLLVTDPRAKAVFECDLAGKLTKLEIVR